MTISRVAYLDCFSGISGDMLLGALIDSGLSKEALCSALESLPIRDDFGLDVKTVYRGPLRATQVQVHVRGDQPHRHLDEITQIIEQSALSSVVKERSIRVFQRLAEAEARVHGTTVETVHFHEVGAIDAIVDVVGAVWGLEALGVKEVYASALPLGPGWVVTDHGHLPLPAPAVLELLAQVNAPTRPGPDGIELVTPTGAALVTSLAQFSQPVMSVERIGYGAGQRELPWPNVVRLWLGLPLETSFASGTVLQVLETNIDDMNPELYGYVMDQLFHAGALDVFFVPIYMKKNRPATMLKVICRPEDEVRLTKLILRETSTLGVRRCSFYRYEADREVHTVNTPLGPVEVKVKRMGNEIFGVAPEYESCRQIAQEKGVALSEVYRLAFQASMSFFEGRNDQD